MHNKFLTQLKSQAEQNPFLAVGAGIVSVTTIAKFIDSISAARGRRAYAKQVNYRLKHGSAAAASRSRRK